MHLRKRVTAAVALPLLLVTAACAGKTSGSPSNGLVVARPLDVVDLSPDGSFLRSSDSQIVALVADSLFRINEKNEIVPAIASAMPTVSADQLAWTIKLRSGVKFSNGAALTSADVKFSLDTAKTGTQQGKLFEPIASIDTPGADTVVIHTKTKDATLLGSLAGVPAAIIPHDFGGMTAAKFYQKPIGAGAFKISERKPSVDLKLVRNSRYYGVKAKLASITFKPVTDASTRVLQLRSGSVDMIEDPPVQQVPALTRDSSFTIVSRPVGVMRLGLNTAKAPLNDVHLRRAISLALDRPSMVKAVLGGRGSPACAWISQTFLRGYQPAFGCATDLTQAKAELAKSAHPHGATVTITYDSGDANMPLTAQIIESDLAKIGVTAKLNGTTSPLYKAALANRTFQGRFSLFALAGDPGLSIANYLDTGAEGTSSPMLPQIKTQYAQTLDTFDDTARFKMYDNVMNEIAQNADAVALYSPDKMWATAAKVKGAAILATNKMNFADISIAG